jgi:hypothetical protein
MTLDERLGESPGGANRDCKEGGVVALRGAGVGGAGGGGGLKSIAMEDRAEGAAGFGGAVANKLAGFFTSNHRSLRGVKSLI